jgi:hypothetical protein
LTERDRDSKRAQAGKRWTHDADERLLALSKSRNDAATIASILRRSYSSVQNRLQKLHRLLIENAESLDSGVQIAPKRSSDTYPDMDLTCGAISGWGQQIVRALWEDIQADNAITRRREPSSFKIEVQCLVGAIVRETFISSEEKTWARISVSRIRAENVGVDGGAVRNILGALMSRGFLERFVGYSDALRIENSAATSGRVTLLRASPRLTAMCKEAGLCSESIFSHFPSLGGPPQD